MSGVCGLILPMNTNTPLITYKVTFYGSADLTLYVDSPLETTPETEENVHTIADIAESIVKLKFGEDFLDKIEFYGTSIEAQDEEIEL
jgi:hypothetical protein